MSGVAVGLSEYLTPLIAGLRATEYMFAACAALWTYDYFLTIDREIALVWPSRWSFGKVIYFLNRYFPILVVILVNVGLRGVKHQGECPKVAKAGFWSYGIGFFWSETILAMRAWALWGGTRNVLIVLTIFTMVAYVSEIVLMDRFIESIISIPIPESLVPILGFTCAEQVKSHDVFWPELLLFILFETVVGTMALSRGFQRYRALNNPLLETMFHDGLLYYIYIFGLVVANIVVTLAAPIQWVFFLEQPLGTLSSIFATRVLLNIRATYFRPHNNNNNNTYTNGCGAISTNLDFRTQQFQTVSDYAACDVASCPADGRDLGAIMMDELGYVEQGQFLSGQGWIWTNSPREMRLATAADLTNLSLIH